MSRLTTSLLALASLAACTGAPPAGPPDADPCAVADADPARDAGVDAALADVAYDAPARDVAPSAPPQLPLPGYYDARAAPYGARGDGVTDDTAAIQRALDAAAHYPATNGGDDGQPGHGGVVYLAPGNYLVRGHLSIAPFVALRGAFVPTTGAFDPATAGATRAVLLAVEDAGNADGTPFIALAAGATLEGVAVYYPHQTNTDPPVAYPWTIREGGIQASVLDVGLVNSYQGIDIGSAATGRHLVRGVYGQPLLVGLRVDHSLDIGRLEDVHFEPIWQPDPTSPARHFQLAHGTAFVLLRADWEQLVDDSATGYAIGLDLGESPLTWPGGLCGGATALITDLGFDATDVGIKLDDASGSGAGIVVDGYRYTAAAEGASRLAVWHPVHLASLLVLSHATITGSYAQAVAWQGDGRLTLDASTLAGWDPARPAVDLQRGLCIVRGTAFGANGAGVAIAAAASARVIAVDNALHGNRVTGAITASGNTP